jgi:CRP-like cAMP-binding protein
VLACSLSLSLRGSSDSSNFKERVLGVCLDYGASMPAPLFYEDCKHWQEELKSWLDGFIDCMVWWAGGGHWGRRRRRGNSLKSVLRSTLGTLITQQVFFGLLGVLSDYKPTATVVAATGSLLTYLLYTCHENIMFQPPDS